MKSERVTFVGAGGDRLAARLGRPADGEIRATALFAHCFTCSKDLKAAVNISRALTQAGFAVLRFDFTGLGESEGDFADTTFSSNVEDLVVAADFLAAELAPPSLLLGHSLGGAAVLRAASDIPSVDAVVTIGAPFDPTHVKGLFDDALPQIESQGAAEVDIAGRRFTVKKEFVEDLEAQNSARVVRELRRPLLILHSPVDEIIGIDNAALLYEAAKHPKSFVSLDDADHLLTRQADSLYVGHVVAAWASRYLEERPERSQSESEMMDRERVVARTQAGAFRTEVLARGHPLLADEPTSVGGEDLGPTPYDLLAAGLATCTSMTLRMYADRKSWPLEAATVRVRHRKVHARDEERSDGDDARIDRMEREIELEGDLSSEQRERLLEIADRCPVHRTLSAGVAVESARWRSPE